mmetsp:Transcript_18431/g.40431  ORF Transcript_18431/g.40431 Transcript_18431/m.40431 type:complete len:491 (-) Transcript_18431:11-1483(-)
MADGLFSFDLLDEVEGKSYKQVINLDEHCPSSAPISRTVDKMLWCGDADTARAVAFFGPAIVVLPTLGEASGLDDDERMSYTAFAEVVSQAELAETFGSADPHWLLHLVQEKRSNEELCLEVKALTNKEVSRHVKAFMEWYANCKARMQAVECRATLAILDLHAESPGDCRRQYMRIMKEFKKKSLSLHPDKGGDAEEFMFLLQLKERMMQELQKHCEGEVEQQDDESSLGPPVPAEEETPIQGVRRGDDEEEVEKQRTAEREASERLSLDANLLEFDRQETESRWLSHRGKCQELWAYSGRLASTIRRGQERRGAGDSHRQLQQIVHRFVSVETGKLLKLGDAGAQRIIDRFNEHNSQEHFATFLRVLKRLPSVREPEAVPESVVHLEQFLGKFRDSCAVPAFQAKVTQALEKKRPRDLEKLLELAWRRAMRRSSEGFSFPDMVIMTASRLGEPRIRKVACTIEASLCLPAGTLFSPATLPGCCSSCLA